jgi:hypothetical protein
MFLITSSGNVPGPVLDSDIDGVRARLRGYLQVLSSTARMTVTHIGIKIPRIIPMSQ